MHILTNDRLAELKQSPRSADVTDVEDLCDCLESARMQIAELEREINAADAVFAERDRLRAAAQAVVDRWDTPLWKDAPATAQFINALRNALPPPR